MTFQKTGKKFLQASVFSIFIIMTFVSIAITVAITVTITVTITVAFMV